MRTILLLFSCSLIWACSVTKQLHKSAQEVVLNDAALQTAHVGISIYEPATARYLYNYQGDKYFVPASNTKIPTCYAAMKYLGDSLVGLEYAIEDTFLLFRGTGDPTLLHPDFKNQKVLNYLKQEKKTLVIIEADFKDNRWGAGWGIGDITASYAPERSEIPVYGNTVRIFKRGDTIASLPSLYGPQIQVAHPIDWKINFERPSLSDNFFSSLHSNQTFTSQEIPFVTGGYMSALVLLMDTLKKNILLPQQSQKNRSWNQFTSQPTDSLLKPMMHRSDNFFAEQTLLMVSHERLGVMSDEKIIDTLLKTDFKQLPQKPRWVDGSGLSRYNLFSPQDFVFILNKMKTEFGMARIKNIFATGGEGTLSSYYKKDSTFIYAKTGTLSGVVAISGFLFTKKGKELIFSVLVNNHQGSATGVRRAVEKFIGAVREKY
ncbi:MAG TPA: D-alanyl-D-alanine carboxypeptidase [Flavisolibacter sp.]|nr:D-alanyl-D-alanine carboxypeptidase [Flavisolibacter sp.]